MSKSYYLVFFKGWDNNDYDIVNRNLKDLFGSYYINYAEHYPGAAIIRYDKPVKDCAEIRDMIKGKCNASVLVIKIKPEGGAAGSGVFALKDNWEWIKTFVSTAKNNADIPNAGFNINNDNTNIGL